MLLSDGEYLITYCTSNLHCITRRAPFGQAKLIDDDVTIDFQQETTPNDVVTVIATQPLTNNEQWQKMERGELKVFRFGEQLFAITIWKIKNRELKLPVLYLHYSVCPAPSSSLA